MRRACGKSIVSWSRVAKGALAVLSVLVVTSFGAVSHAAPATPAFVQVRAAEVKSGTTNSLAFTSPTTAGNLIAVYVIWSNGGAATVSDNRGNVYSPATNRTSWGSGWSSQVFFARGHRRAERRRSRPRSRRP